MRVLNIKISLMNRLWDKFFKLRNQQYKDLIRLTLFVMFNILIVGRTSN